jgi:hypothetical protein
MSKAEQKTEQSYFDGYSDYQSVSKDIGSAVADAIDAYGYLIASDGRNNRQKKTRAHGRILAAAMRLLPEMEQSKSVKPELEEIYQRWVGDSEAEQGYLEMLEDADFGRQAPEWLTDFVFEIRKAAWKLGYLRAGKEKTKQDQEIDTKQSEQMFANL